MELTTIQLAALKALEVKVNATDYSDWRGMREHKSALADILKGTNK